MRSIVKHELRVYFHSSATYILGGLFFLIAAIYFFVDNMKGHRADIAPLYNTLGILLLFILPIMTARVLAEERKNGMEILLITSPVSVTEIIIGKFFAIMIIFIAMLALTLIFPLFLCLFTPIYPLSIVSRYIGLILLSAAITAFGVFASSLTENQVVAAIVSFVGLLIVLIARPIGIAIGGKFADTIGWLSIFARYDEMNQGIFRLNTVVYDVSFVFIFLFLAIQVTKSRRIDQGGAV